MTAALFLNTVLCSFKENGRSQKLATDFFEEKSRSILYYYYILFMSFYFGKIKCGNIRQYGPLN